MDGDEEEEMSLKIYGKTLKAYFEAADKRNASGRCFQCLSKEHRAADCKKVNCKFCEQPSDKVRHLSLLCPRCPKVLTKFLEVRDSNVQQRKNVLRIADDFRDFHFQDSDFSDTE